MIVAFTNSIDSLDGWINILQAIQLPFALFPLLKFTSSSNIMEEFKNPFSLTCFCTVVSLLVIIINLGTVVPRLLDTDNDGVFEWTSGKLIILAIAVIYFTIIYFVLKSPTKPPALLDSSNATFEVS